jgi:hypothetical protein
MKYASGIKISRWSFDEISFSLIDDQSEDPIVTIEVAVPGGKLFFMGEPEAADRALIVRGVHVHSEGLGPNGVGVHNLRVVAEAIMEAMEYDEICIEGEIRTSGANPGRRPRLLRFSRGRVA